MHISNLEMRREPALRERQEGDRQRKRERVGGLLPPKMKEASLWVSFRGEGECYHSCAALV